MPGNAEHIRPLIREGVCAFKAFLCPSGIDEFPNVTEADLRQVMPILAEAGIPLFVHAELVSPLPPGVEEHFAANPRSYQAYLATRPPEWEVDGDSADDRLVPRISVSGAYRASVGGGGSEAAHQEGQGGGAAVHGRDVPALPDVFRGRNSGRRNRSSNAPRRSVVRDQQGHLRAMVAVGLIDTLGSDHSPAPPEMKHLTDGNFAKAWGGIASLQLLLPAVMDGPRFARNAGPAD